VVSDGFRWFQMVVKVFRGKIDLSIKANIQYPIIRGEVEELISGEVFAGICPFFPNQALPVNILIS
jgi:hypothetical protein